MSGCGRISCKKCNVERSIKYPVSDHIYTVHIFTTVFFLGGFMVMWKDKICLVVLL